MPTVEQKNFSIKSNPDVWAAAGCLHTWALHVGALSKKILNQDTQNEFAKIVPTLMKNIVYCLQILF